MDQLISALTADGRPDELAGRDAALAAFRAAGQRAATEPTLRQRRVVPSSPTADRLVRRGLPRSPPRRPWSSPLVVTAAYTHALPGPVQDAAHIRLRAARRARRPARVLRHRTEPGAGGHHRRYPARRLPLLRHGVQDTIAAIR